MISMKINGVSRQFHGSPDMPLLWYVRDELGLTGSKFGCGAALCGACTMHVDGEAVRACVTPVSEADGRDVTTIEGLDPDGNHPVQRAWRAHNVPQCGYCQSGQIMSAAALLNETPDPSDEEIVDGMGRQHLPLRHLPADLRCGPHSGAGGLIMLGVQNISRRTFLKSAGGHGRGRARRQRHRRFHDLDGAWPEQRQLDPAQSLRRYFRRRNGHAHVQPVRDGSGRAHRHPDDPGRRA